jgi:hypothetical protein
MLNTVPHVLFAFKRDDEYQYPIRANQKYIVRRLYVGIDLPVSPGSPGYDESALFDLDAALNAIRKLLGFDEICLLATGDV